MEIANIEYKGGKYRLCLDQVDSSETEFRLAWRGNKATKDGFVNKPAYFEWDQLGELIRRSFLTGKIKEKDINNFLINLLGYK